LRATRALDALVLVVGLLALGVFLFVTLRRVGHPFELEWIEGGALGHVERILAGEKLYVAPSLEFVPFVYTPLYFYVAAGAAAILGGGFLPLRLVSLAASLGCLAIVYLYARRLAGARLPAAISACFFAATYGASGAWLDLARVDALFVVLLLLAFYFQRAPATRASLVLAGVFLSLSILTKQAGVVIAAPLMAHAMFFHRRLAGWLVGMVVGIVGLSTLILDALHDGWFLYYALLPWKDVGERQATWLDLVAVDILRPLPIAMVLVLWFLWTRRRTAPRSELLFDLVLLLAAVGGCLLARLRSGGYLNVLIPLHAVLAMYLGPAAWGLAARAREEKERMGMSLLTRGALLLQFALVAYAPDSLVPTARDVAAGEECVRTIAAIDGDVWVPFHAYLADRAGKGGFGRGDTGVDILRGDSGPVGVGFAREIQEAIRSRKFEAILLDESALLYWTQFWPLFEKDFTAYYEVRARLFDGKDVFWPRSGTRTRPDLLLVPGSGPPLSPVRP
jgi:4-amino-4-deoxy-L-arabinose transferase-like glycosyltransferase